MLDPVALAKHAGPISDLLEKMEGPNGFQWERTTKQMLRGELVGAPNRWKRNGDIVQIIVSSDGTTGPQWVEIFKRKGVKFSTKYTEEALLSPAFTPTSGVVTELAILPPNSWGNWERCTEKVRGYATTRNLSAPDIEVACILRDMFTAGELLDMGLSHIVVMHDPPVKIESGQTYNLAVAHNSLELVSEFPPYGGEGYHDFYHFAFKVASWKNDG